MVDTLTDPKIWLLILFISAWGALARLANFYAGQRGKGKIIELYPRIDSETWERVLRSFQRCGPIPLLLASLPIIGTVLTIGSGMAGISRASFLALVMLSKIIRNWILVLLLMQLT